MQAHIWFAIDTSVSMASELLSSANALLTEVLSDLRTYEETSLTGIRISAGILAFGIDCAVIQPMMPVEKMFLSSVRIGQEIATLPQFATVYSLIRDRRDAFKECEAESLPNSMSSCVALRKKLDDLTKDDCADLVCLCLFSDGMLTDPEVTVRRMFTDRLSFPKESGQRTEARFLVWFCNRAELAVIDPKRLQAFCCPDPEVETIQVTPADFTQRLISYLTDWEHQREGNQVFQTIFSS